MKNNIFLIVLLMVLLHSCSQDLSPVNDDYSVKFSATILSSSPSLRILPYDGWPATEGGASAWTIDDAVGIYQLANTNDINIDNVLGDQYLYMVEADTQVTASLIPYASSIYFPLDGSMINFQAIYPYAPPYAMTLTDTDCLRKVDVSDQSSPGGISIMHADDGYSFLPPQHSQPFKSYNKNSQGPIPLNFYHVMANFIFKVEAGPGMTKADLEFLTVAVNGIYSEGQYSLRFHKFVNMGPIINNVLPQGNPSHDTFIYQMVMIPQKLTNDGDISVDFTITNNSSIYFGTTYHWALPASTDFVSGTQYLYNVFIGAKSVEIAAGSPKINFWSVGTPGDIDAN